MTDFVLIFRILLALTFSSVVIFWGPLRRWWTAKRYTRGRREVGRKTEADKTTKPDGALRWGNSWLPGSSATQHFLCVGTTGSGKSHVQRLLMERPLREIDIDSDKRAVIFDAKNDFTAYLKHIGVTCPVFSLNPFEARTDFPMAVRWDIARDITSPARAQNIAAGLIPQEKGGANQYFTDAARQVLVGVIESFIRHSGSDWTFSDLVYASLSQDRITELLRRDSPGPGQDVLDGFFGDDRTSYQVFTTICSRISTYRPVAALWQRTEKALSIRDWLQENGSILLLGANATAKTSLDAINEQVFRVMTEEIDVQSNSSTRRTWVWIDEARLAGPLLKGELLPYLAVKGRSRGVGLVIAFQDIEGLREAAGERIANELVAQFSNKALLRQESDASAQWSSKQLGQVDTIQYFTSDNLSALSQNISAQRVVKDSVLASEFFEIKPTNPKNGLTGYFLSPEFGAYRGTVSGRDIGRLVVSESSESRYAMRMKPIEDQWLSPWNTMDRERLSLVIDHCRVPNNITSLEQRKRKSRRRTTVRNESEVL